MPAATDVSFVTYDQVADFLAVPDAATFVLEVTHPVDAEPRALFDALNADAGFAEKTDLCPEPPHGGQQRRTLTRSGSGLFGGWTAAERAQFLSEARAVLAQHGHTDVHEFVGQRD